jgi:hypothetical protein
MEGGLMAHLTDEEAVAIVAFCKVAERFQTAESKMTAIEAANGAGMATKAAVQAHDERWEFASAECTEAFAVLRKAIGSEAADRVANAFGLG